MRFVGEILRRKGHEVATIRAEQSVYEMLEIMTHMNIGAVVVVDGEQMLGIATERDYARSVVLLGRTSKETTIREIMTSEPMVVTPTHRLQHCMSMMTEHRVRHLPVMDGEQLVGIISIGDVVKAIMDEQQALISDLEAYISPTR